MASSLAILGMLLLTNAEPCPPKVVLEGDPKLVDAVREKLSRRELPPPAPDCEPLTVTLKDQGPEVLLAIATPDLKVQRTASDLQQATTIIESWARREITDPLLDHPLPEQTRTPIRPDPKEGTLTPYRRPPPAKVAAPRPFSVSVGGVAGVANDGSKWSGADLRGCFQLWRLCMGGRLQYAVDLEIGGDADALRGSRSLFDLFLTADAPLALGAFRIAPGVGLGQAILTSERVISDGRVVDDAGGLRLRAQLGISFRFAADWALRLDAAVDYAPDARSEIYESVEEDGPEDVQLAGEPKTMGWLRIGIELGGI